MMAEMGRRDGGIEVFVAESRMTMFSFHIYWLIFASTPFRPFRNHTFQTLGLSNDTLPDFYYYGILPKRPQRRSTFLAILRIYIPLFIISAILMQMELFPTKKKQKSTKM
jgi:hypothetical protein